MPLLTIADLAQPEKVLAPYMTRAQNLSQVYLDQVVSSQEDHQRYTVEIFGSKKRAPGVHASELSKCMRALVYGIMGMERKANKGADVNMLMRFKMGHAIHALVQYEWSQIAEKSEGLIQFEDEVKVSPEVSAAAAQWNIRSSCDGIITCCAPQGGGPQVRVGLEIKTISDDGYKKLRQPQSDH